MTFKVFFREITSERKEYNKIYQAKDLPTLQKQLYDELQTGQLREIFRIETA